MFFVDLYTRSGSFVGKPQCLSYSASCTALNIKHRLCSILSMHYGIEAKQWNGDDGGSHRSNCIKVLRAEKRRVETCLFVKFLRYSIEVVIYY